MTVNNSNISADLMKKAIELSKGGVKSFDAVKFQELKTIALADGKLTKDESAFIANLDNQTVLNKILSSDFDPNSFSIKIDKTDKTLTLSNDVKFDVGEGKKVFNSSGKLDPSVLKGLKQRDDNANTVGDNARCSCNDTVVALAAKGKASMIQGMSSAMGLYISKNVGKVSPEELNQKIGTMAKLIADAEKNNLTAQDLNTFASFLYEMYDTNKYDNIMTYEDVSKMQKELGVSKGEKKDIIGDSVGKVIFERQAGEIVPTGGDVDVNSDKFKNAQKKLANKVIDGIGNGQTATVSVFNGAGGTNNPNHFVLAGKDDNGKLFVYHSDPMSGEKTYYEGDEAKAFLSKKIGISFENERVIIPGKKVEYEAKVGAPVIK